MPEHGTTISTTVVIRNSRQQKALWFPTLTKVEGIDFIKLGRWCRDWTRYVTGKALDLRKDKMQCISGRFWDALVADVHRASRDAVQKVLDEQQEAEAREQGKDVPAKRRKRAVCENDRFLAPATVSVCLPAVGSTPEKEVQIWLELDALTLEHVREGIVASGSPSKGKKRSTMDPAEPDVSL